MKTAVRIILILNILILATGFYLQYKEVAFAEKVIGFGVLLTVFVLLPLFLYYRYRNKNLQDYLLTQDKFEKLKDNFKKNS